MQIDTLQNTYDCVDNIETNEKLKTQDELLSEFEPESSEEYESPESPSNYDDDEDEEEEEEYREDDTSAV